MVYIKRKFVWFKVPLNHRLARKISKELDKLPEDTLLYRAELNNLKKYLKRMRKNNYRRFYKGEHRSRIEKRIRDRCIRVSANGGISINNCCPNPSYTIVDSNEVMSFETIMYCILHKGERMPF